MPKPKKYNSKGKEILILGLLYRRNKAKFKEIRDYLKEKTGCADSTIIARLENLKRKKYIKKEGRGTYIITGEGRREYFKNKPLEDARDVIKSEKLPDILTEIRGLKESFTYSIFIFGEFHGKIDPKEVIKEIDENFTEEDKSCYIIYFIEKYGISYLIHIFPDKFTLFGGISEINTSWTIIDYGPITSWAFLLLGLSYYVSIIGRVCDLKKVATTIERVLFIDHTKDEYMEEAKKRYWMDYITEKVKFEDLPKHRLHGKISMRSFEMDERMRSLWGKFCEIFDKKYEDREINILFDFKTDEDYLEECEKVGMEQILENKYFILIYGGACKVVINYDWLKELDDEEVLHTFDKISHQCIQGIERLGR